MAHTWIQEPDVVMPPVLKGIYHVGFVIKEMPRHWFSRFDVEVTIKGSLRCDGGQIRNVEAIVRVNVMVPIDTTEMAIGALMKGVWLKATWWVTRGIRIVAPIVRNEQQVEALIKSFIDNSDKICQGAADFTTRRHIEIKQPIWLNDEFRPMIVLPADSARIDWKNGRRLA